MESSCAKERLFRKEGLTDRSGDGLLHSFYTIEVEFLVMRIKLKPQVLSGPGASRVTPAHSLSHAVCQKAPAVRCEQRSVYGRRYERQ